MHSTKHPLCNAEILLKGKRSCKWYSCLYIKLHVSLLDTTITVYRHSIHRITFLVHVVTSITLKFLTNSIDRSVIYDKHILGKWQHTFSITHSFETLSIDSVCFNASNINIVMELLSNYNVSRST